MYLTTDADSEFRSLAVCTLDGHIDTLVDSRLGRRGVRPTRTGRPSVWVVNEDGRVGAVCLPRPQRLGTPSCGDAGVRSGRRARGVRRHPRRRARSSACGGPARRPTDLVRIDVATGSLSSISPTAARLRCSTPNRSPRSPSTSRPMTNDGSRRGCTSRPATGRTRWCCRSTADPESQERAEYMYSGPVPVPPRQRGRRVRAQRPRLDRLRSELPETDPSRLGR